MLPDSLELPSLLSFSFPLAFRCAYDEFLPDFGADFAILMPILTFVTFCIFDMSGRGFHPLLLSVPRGAQSRLFQIRTSPVVVPVT